MILEPHMALFVAPIGVRKTLLALDLLEREYFNHFDFIVILCPSFDRKRRTTNGRGFGLILTSFR